MALRFSLPIPLSGADDRSLPPAILPPGAVHGSATQSASFKRISLTRLELKIPVCQSTHPSCRKEVLTPMDDAAAES